MDTDHAVPVRNVPETNTPTNDVGNNASPNVLRRIPIVETISGDLCPVRSLINPVPNWKIAATTSETAAK